MVPMHGLAPIERAVREGADSDSALPCAVTQWMIARLSVSSPALPNLGARAMRATARNSLTIRSGVVAAPSSTILPLSIFYKSQAPLP